MVDNILNREDLPQADYPTLQWSESAPPIKVTSRTDLETRLRDLASQYTDHPIIVVLTMPNGSCGLIGLGREESIMFLQRPTGPDGWTEEWLPIVEEERKGVTEFFLLGWHHSEFENRRLLPIDDAIRAIGEFFESGTRPGWIRWEENKF
jgi:immunity protein Imm1 of predicted polymorphic toxin system